jgi:flagellar M-ring protein FliF
VAKEEEAEGFALAPTLGYEERLRSVKELARQEPKVVANVVKDWIGTS